MVPRYWVLRPSVVKTTKDIQKGESIGCKLATAMWLRSRRRGPGRVVRVGQQLRLRALVVGWYALALSQKCDTMAVVEIGICGEVNESGKTGEVDLSTKQWCTPVKT